MPTEFDEYEYVEYECMCDQEPCICDQFEDVSSLDLEDDYYECTCDQEPCICDINLDEDDDIGDIESYQVDELEDDYYECICDQEPCVCDDYDLLSEPINKQQSSALDEVDNELHNDRKKKLLLGLGIGGTALAIILGVGTYALFKPVPNEHHNKTVLETNESPATITHKERPIATHRVSEFNPSELRVQDEDGEFESFTPDDISSELPSEQIGSPIDNQPTIVDNTGNSIQYPQPAPISTSTPEAIAQVPPAPPASNPKPPKKKPSSGGSGSSSRQKPQKPEKPKPQPTVTVTATATVTVTPKPSITPSPSMSVSPSTSASPSGLPSSSPSFNPIQSGIVSEWNTPTDRPTSKPSK